MNRSYPEQTDAIEKLIAENKPEQASIELEIAKLQAQHKFIDSSFAMKQLRHQEQKIKNLREKT